MGRIMTTDIKKLVTDIEKEPGNESHYIQLGLAYYDQKEMQKARETWERGLIYCPNSSGLLNNMAVILVESKEYAKAKLLIDRQVKIKPTAIAYNNLGLIAYRELKLQHAVSCFKNALKLDPEFDLAISNLGFMYQELKEFEKAKTLYAQALKKNPKRVELLYKLSDLYLMLGDYEQGFELYEKRFEGLGRAQMAKALDNMQSLSIDKWDGNRVDSLLILVEQGHGDNLMMMRYIPRVKELADRVVVACDKSMNRLFSQFGVEVRNDLDTDTGCSAFVMIMSLPYLFKETTHTLKGAPYLKVNEVVPHEKFKPRVGICWQGSSSNIKDFTRSIDVGIFATLLLIEDFSFVSLQRGLVLNGIDNSINECQDFYDTAKLMNSLDLVISVDTSVIHLAGALGIPSILLNRSTSEWRWGVSGPKSIWYDSVHIVRQKELGDWKPTIVDAIKVINQQFKLSDKSLGKLEAYYLLRKEIEFAKAISEMRI